MSLIGTAIVATAGGYVGSSVGTTVGHAAYDGCKVIYHGIFDRKKKKGKKK